MHGLGGANESEVYDFVTRNAPVSHRDIMNQQSVYSSDAIATALDNLADDDEIGSRKGSLEEDGTTEVLFYPKEDGDAD